MYLLGITFLLAVLKLSDGKVFKEYSNEKYKNWNNVVTKIIRKHVKQCSYHKGYWKYPFFSIFYDRKALNAIYTV